MKTLRWLVALLALAGCTTLGEPYSPPPPLPEGKARVYFMRSAVGYGNFWTTVFSVNDTEAISLYDKGYSWIYLAPGTYKFSAGTVMKQEYLKFEMPVQAGREYFIEYNQEPGGYQRVRNVIRAVNPALGNGLVQKYTYKAADKQDFQPVAR
jgi:hypothetical protein